MNYHKKTILILLPLILVLVAFAIYQNAYGVKPKPRIEWVREPSLTVEVVQEVAQLIKDKNFSKLSSFVGEDGVIIKPYYSPNEEQGIKLTKEELSSMLTSSDVRTWGVQDGSGIPIEMTGKEFYEKYLYSYDFVAGAKLIIEESVVSGNTLPLDEVLPSVFKDYNTNYKFAEYYIDQIDPQYGGMDWQSLALIFKVVGGEWKLVGIFHNEWTI